MCRPLEASHESPALVVDEACGFGEIVKTFSPGMIWTGTLVGENALVGVPVPPRNSHFSSWRNLQDMLIILDYGIGWLLLEVFSA